MEVMVDVQEFKRLVALGKQLNDALADARSSQQRQFAEELLAQSEFDMVCILALEHAVDFGVSLDKRLADAARGAVTDELLEDEAETFHQELAASRHLAA